MEEKNYMALIKCPECGKEISDKADKCIHCGYPIESAIPEEKADRSKAQDVDEKKDSKGLTGEKILSEKVKAGVSQDIVLEERQINVNTKSVSNKMSKKAKIVSFAIIVIAVSGILVFSLTTDMRGYNKGKSFMSEGKYDKAMEAFAEIEDYKDSDVLWTESVYEYGRYLMDTGDYKSAIECFDKIQNYNDAKALNRECARLYEIQTDTEPPVIKGIESGSTIEAEYRSEFNIKQYVEQKISIEDNVTEKISTYDLITESDVYDSESGAIDTNQPGEYQFTINAQDEAGNEGKLGFTVKVKDIVYLNADNPNPVVYEGKDGTISIQSCIYGFINGLQQYEITFSITNSSDNTMSAWLYDVYIDGTRVQAYTDAVQIAAGKNGDTHSYICDEDLTEEMKSFSEAEATFCMGTSALDRAKDSRIIMINRNAIQ